MFNEMLIKEKFFEMANQLKVILEYVKEAKSRDVLLKKEIKSLKEQLRKVK